MITYEEAKKKALKARPGITTAYEYPTAYFFVGNEDEDDSEIVILKKDGRAVSMSDFIAIAPGTLPDPKKIKF